MFLDFLQLEPFLQLVFAVLLGAAIGYERERKGKEAGLRTFSLVALGTCFFTLTAAHFGLSQGSSTEVLQIDPTRVIQAVAIGIGFIGSGLIIQRKAQVEGLTTAAALWATAAVGIGIGLGLYYLSAVGALLIIIILVVLKEVEKKIFHKED